jgi:hypothetical protein
VSRPPADGLPERAWLTAGDLNSVHAFIATGFAARRQPKRGFQHCEYKRAGKSLN